MRIVIASDQFWPMISGVATSGRTLALGLTAAGHDVLVVAPSQTGKRYEEMDESYRIVRTRSIRFPTRENLRISLALQKEIRKIIEDFKPDIVHSNTPFLVGFAALKVARKLGIPTVATNHVMPENLIENARILMPIARPLSHVMKEYGMRLFRDADHITMPTQAAIDMFKVDGVDIPVTAISNGIDLSRFKPGTIPQALRSRYHLPEDRPIVTCLCRLDGEKHVHILLEAAKLLLAGNPVHFLIIGYGNVIDDLKQLAQDLGIAEHVTFTGYVSDDEVIQLQRAGTLFAMPSPAELQCLAMLEAMASGQPVVAVNAGALYELCVDGENGFLCNVDDPQDMAQKIETILRDHPLRQKMSQESLRIAEQHDIRNVIKQFEKLYKEVIAATHHTENARKTPVT